MLAHIVYSDDAEESYNVLARLMAGTSSNYVDIATIDGDKGLVWDDEYYVTLQSNDDNQTVINRLYKVGAWSLSSEVEVDFSEALVPQSIVYHEANDCAYSVFYDKSRSAYFMQQVRLEDGRLVVVSDTEMKLDQGIYALCVSPDGAIYGFGNDSYLYKIDPKRELCDKMFSTRSVGMDNQSAWYDENSHSIYRSVSSSIGVSIYNYNIDSEAEKFVKIYTDAQAILFMTPDNYVNRDAPPKGVMGLSVTMAHDRMSGTITCTAPTLDVSGYPLPDAPISVISSIDQVAIDTLQVMPGAVCEVTFDVSEGLHSLSVVAANEYGAGPVATSTIFGGFDNPLPVENVMFATDFPYVYMAWNEPMGVNGYVVDSQSLRYRVTRYPDGVVVADTTACEVCDSLPAVPQNYYYGVVAYLPNFATAETFSTEFYYDCIIELPYRLTQWNSVLSQALIIDDANADGCTWGYYETASGEASMRYHYSGVNDADDYLYSPVMHLPAGQLIELTLYMRAGSDKFAETFAIGVAPDDNIDNRRQLLEQQQVDSKTSTPYRVQFTVDEDAAYRIYVHCTSPANHYMLHLDGLSIAVCGDGSLPQAPHMTAEVDGDAPHRVNVACVVPTHFVDGAALDGVAALNIYRNEALIYTHEQPMAGECVAYCDSVSEIGYYTYQCEVVAEGGANKSTPCEVVAGVAQAPFYHDFAQGAGFFTINDRNQDGLTWHYYDDRFMGCMRYVSSDVQDADDWFISPPIYMETSMRYQVEYSCCAGLSFYPESMRLLMGREVQPNGFSIVLDELTDFTFVNDSLIVVPFDIYAPGNYYIAFHAVSRSDSYSIMLRSMAVNEYDPTALQSTSLSDSKVWGGDDAVVVQSAAACPVAIYDAMGCQVAHFVTQHSREEYPLPAGIYVVLVDNVAHKVVVR